MATPFRGEEGGGGGDGVHDEDGECAQPKYECIFVEGAATAAAASRTDGDDVWWKMASGWWWQW